MESRQINRKPLNVPDDLKIRILGLIDSRDMHEYCRNSSETWTVYQYAELIASAPKSMEKKTEILQALMNLPMEEDQSQYLSECCLVAQTAMECLYKNQQGRIVLLVRSMDTEFPEISCMGTEPVLSYDGFLQYIRKEFMEDGAGDLGEIPECSDFYFILDLYENSESDTLKHIYRYICAPNGEIRYFEKITDPIRRIRDNEKAGRLHECTNLFSGRNGLNSWKTPFKVGDILYVDCRPYFLPTYCVIHYVDPEMPSDCCGLRCLFPTHEFL
ncbi:MAG: hypothetical protein LIO96_02570 [Lachnospiraceae bacterium]|nr:hypothetical protein [Lachnospiraceae bacterium]